MLEPTENYLTYINSLKHVLICNINERLENILGASLYISGLILPYLKMKAEGANGQLPNWPTAYQKISGERQTQTFVS